MVAMARVVHEMHGRDVRTVFIGPCLAKKVEASMSELEGEVDAVITFAELRTMFLSHGVDVASTEGTDFDPPHAGTGSCSHSTGGCFRPPASARIWRAPRRWPPTADRDRS